MNKKELLPWSNGRYNVSETSDVYDGDILVEVVEIEENKFLELDWYNGKKLYPKELVIICAFDVVDFKEFHNSNIVDRIEVIFRDGDKNNFFSGNLTYVFSGEAIQSETKEGFYLIPNWPGYVLSKTGELFSYRSNSLKTWCLLKTPESSNRRSGYMYSTLYEKGKEKHCYQHRLLCLVFKKFIGIFNKLTVNHLDGVKSNNKLDNLEWATYSENNQHALDTKLKVLGQKVLVKNLLTDQIWSFEKLRDCAKWLGENHSFYITERLRDKTNKIYPDLLAFKNDDGTEWLNYDLVNCSEEINILNIVALNVFTNEMRIYSDALICSLELGVKTALILDHCRHERLLPHNGYNFRFLSRADNWPQHTRRHLEIYKLSPIKPSNGIIVFDKLTNKETFYPLLEMCAKAFGIHKRMIMTLACTGNSYQKRYTFKYFELKKSLIESQSAAKPIEI